jgi:integrase
MLIADGWDVVEVSKRLRHADIATTMRTYLHEIENAERAQARRASLDRLDRLTVAKPGEIRQIGSDQTAQR